MLTIRGWIQGEDAGWGGDQDKEGGPRGNEEGNQEGTSGDPGGIYEEAKEDQEGNREGK